MSIVWGTVTKGHNRPHKNSGDILVAAVAFNANLVPTRLDSEA